MQTCPWHVTFQMARAHPNLRWLSWPRAVCHWKNNIEIGSALSFDNMFLKNVTRHESRGTKHKNKHCSTRFELVNLLLLIWKFKFTMLSKIMLFWWELFLTFLENLELWICFWKFIVRKKLIKIKRWVSFCTKARSKQ